MKKENFRDGFSSANMWGGRIKEKWDIQLVVEVINREHLFLGRGGEYLY